MNTRARYSNYYYEKPAEHKSFAPMLTTKHFFCYLWCLLFLLLIPTNGRSQNPALPPADCQYPIGEFDHFEVRTDGLRLFSKLADGWEIAATYDSTAALISIDTIGRDTTPTFSVVMDSVLVERNYLGEVMNQRILPHSLWMPDNPTIPSSGVSHAVLLDSAYYFLWGQSPLSASWPGKIKIIKTDYNFNLIAAPLELGGFSSWQGIEYFGLVSNDLIGCSYNTAGGQNTGMTSMQIFDKDLVSIIQITNYIGGAGSPPPGTGLKRLTNNCFAYNEIYTESSGKVNHYKVYHSSNGQIQLLNSKWLKTTQLSSNPLLYHFETVFKAWDETGIPIIGKSDKLLPVNPLYVTPNPAAMNYYAVDTLHIVAPITVSDSLAAYFTLYSFHRLYGVVNMGKHLWAIVHLDGNQLVDIPCANPQDSLISPTTNRELSDKVNVFPNPTQDRFYVEPINENEKIDLFSADGRLLTSRIQLLQESTRCMIDLTLLPKGIYFWRIQDKEGRASRWGRIVFE